jgi:hypothetical protein
MMSVKSAFTHIQHIAPTVSKSDPGLNRIYRGLLAGFGAGILLVSGHALAVTEPDLLTTGTYGVLSSTYTNTTAGTTINGDLGYTTGPAANPVVNGTTNVANAAYNQAGIDQGNALVTLNNQTDCTSLGTGAVALDGINLGAGPGVFPPGCYTSGGAMNITVSTTVTLVGRGVYIFRPAGALTTGANSKVVATGGACENDVFWTPIGATTLGANAGPSASPSFIGTIIDDAGIALGHFANLSGRALAFGGVVSTDESTITVPDCPAFVTPELPADGVELAKDFSPTSIAAGGVSRLTITLLNDNTGVATLTAPLTDTLPVQMVIAPTPNVITTCGGVGAAVAIAGGGTLTLPAGRMIPGGVPGTCTVAVNVTSAVVGGSYTNTLGIGALATDLDSNSLEASANLTVAGAAVATTLSSVASPGVTLGGAISDTGTLGGGAAPTGTITFDVFGPDDANCTGGTVFTSLVPVTGNGSYVSASFTPLETGTYRWIANYGGDQGNLPTANTCNAANESVVVVEAQLDVPTISEWAMILLASLLAIVGFVAMRRQAV